MSLAMTGITYIIPTLIIPEIISGFNTDIVKLYRDILVVGAVFYLVGMILGNKLGYRKKRKLLLWRRFSTDIYLKKVSRLTVILTFFAVSGLIICFFLMEHIPLFAKDVFAAKFHKGIYHILYQRVSILFRICHGILPFTIPLLVVLWFYYRKKILYTILLILSLTVMIFCATRGLAFIGLVVGFGILSTHKRHFFKYYLLFLLLIYGVGSSFFYILNISTYDLDANASIFEIMVRGAPDVFDHLGFLTAFLDHPEYTYGRTFWGGFLLGEYYWNPAVWALHIIDGGDVKNVMSGGLRLPVAIWGYVSFSWIGVVFISLISGFLTGIFIKKTKRILHETDNIIPQLLAIILYMQVYSFLSNFIL
jgi:hypothetical protein